MNSAAIAKALVHQVFHAKALLIVPETYWTGHECDLLVVEPGLRVIDVEVKVSRSDFRRDAAKDKWWKSFPYAWDPVAKTFDTKPRERALWPKRVWKHYCAMPESIWAPDMEAFLPSAASGVLLFKETDRSVFWRCERRAKPCREAEPIAAADALDIARLAGLRMWEALAQAEKARRREYEAVARQTEPA